MNVALHISEYFKVSIVTICYNIKDNIEKTLQSISNQTYKQYQWIIIDGGSTDGTLEILEKYSNHFNVFISEKDNGIYHAMNKGIAKSSGEYLFFLNGGDTFYNDNVLETLIEKLDSKYHIIYGNLNCINQNIEYFIRTPSNITKEVLYKGTLPHQAVIFHSKLFKKRKYVTKYSISSDYEFILYSFFNKKAKFLKVDITISNFYLGGASTINKEKSLIENDLIRKKNFGVIYRLKKNKIVKEKAEYIFMLLTHPRYVAGYFKGLIIKWISKLV